MSDDAPPTATNGGPDGFAAARWLRARGLGALLEGTSLDDPGRGRLRLPLAVILAFVVLAEMPATGLPVLPLTLAALTAVAVAAVAAALARRTGRERLVEGAAFVVVPPTLALLVGPMDAAQADALDISTMRLRVYVAVALLAQQLLLLAVVVAVKRFDMMAFTRWLVRELTQSVSTAGTALARVVPLLMIALLLSYYTGELWQSVGKMGALPFFSVILLMTALSGLFLARREHFDVDAAARFETHEELADALRETPAAGHAGRLNMPAACPLTPRQERSLLIAASASRMVLATLIGLVVLAFFLVVGWLTVDATSVRAWSAGSPRPIFSFHGAGHVYLLSWQHVRVAGFLSAFSAFYYAVASATDATMRQGLRDTAAESIRAGCALRLALLNPPADASDEPPF
ncbi:MAG: hypothetical protein KDC33_07280 [Thermoleophilia bacterium]|nr:hypothetical protein [Thermoleophilia bacterium]